MATYGYIRVSTQKQAEEGLSFDTQKRMITGRAMEMGREIDAFFEEEGVSGAKPLQTRPAGERLLARLQKGDVVIATRLDRCFRSALDALGVIKQLKDTGVSLILLDLGGDVTGNGISKMVFTILAAVAEQEREFVRERVVAVKATEKGKGRYLGGIVPFGYTVGEDGLLVPHTQRDAMVEYMIAERQRGASFRTIAASVKQHFNVSVSHEGVKKVVTTKMQ